MKQVLFEAGNIKGAVSGSNVGSSVEWQGGHGWLVVQGFLQIAGSPVLNIATRRGSTAVPVPGLSSPITAAGIYPFYAPKGAFIDAELVAQPTEELNFNGIYLLGDV